MERQPSWWLAFSLWTRLTGGAILQHPSHRSEEDYEDHSPRLQLQENRRVVVCDGVTGRTPCTGHCIPKLRFFARYAKDRVVAYSRRVEAWPHSRACRRKRRPPLRPRRLPRFLMHNNPFDPMRPCCSMAAAHQGDRRVQQQ